MEHKTPVLAYETPRKPNPWAKVSLIGGIIMLFGAVVPICGLAVVPLGWLGLIVGLVGVSLALWGRRCGLLMSIVGSLLCLAAALVPLAMLGAIPFLAELGLKASIGNRASPTPARTPATNQTTPFVPATQRAGS